MAILEVEYVNHINSNSTTFLKSAWVKTICNPLRVSAVSVLSMKPRFIIGVKQINLIFSKCNVLKSLTYQQRPFLKTAPAFKNTWSCFKVHFRANETKGCCRKFPHDQCKNTHALGCCMFFKRAYSRACSNNSFFYKRDL